jgi:AGCS family alanine or glycine:cation symporter
MEMLNGIISSLNNVLWSYVLIAALIGMGIYFTVRTKFVQIRLIKEMFRLLGDKSIASSGSSQKDISSLQSFFIGAATRIGTGNMAGVAIALAVGGPGSIFWMWIVAIIGGATSFIESTLAQVYKVKDENGFRGGPAYYMAKGLNARWLGVIFAVLIALCFGLIFNSVQSNTISSAFKTAFGTNEIVMGVILTVLTASIIFGGVHRIAKFSEIIVPIMAVFYLVISLYVVIMNISEMPAVFSLIFKSAFGFEQFAGGTMGAAIMLGVKRGLFSNEAGMGSAPNAAATASVTHPAKQGLIQTLGVFIDTLIVCSATAFIILLSDQYGNTDLNGIELLQAALASHVGAWANTFVAISIFLFAFSSIIGSYYYGETNIDFIKSSKASLLVYRLMVLGMVAFGTMASLEFVWSLADLAMALMTLINLIAIFLLGKVAFAVLQDYVSQRKEGKEPVFKAESIDGLTNASCWEEETKPEEKIAS